jgi:hypothetical protein
MRGIQLKAVDLISDKFLTFSIDSKFLDFEPVPLGYGVDVLGQPFYCYRNPIRRWKQGLHPENFTHTPLDRAVGFGNTQMMKGILSAIKGKVKSYQEAFEDGGVFHRHFCIIPLGPERFLEYKGERIGTLNEDGFVLSEAYAYLEKYVQEVIEWSVKKGQ